MEVCVQGIHEQGTGVHKLLLGPLQPCDGSVHRGTLRAPEVTRRLCGCQLKRHWDTGPYPFPPSYFCRMS